MDNNNHKKIKEIKEIINKYKILIINKNIIIILTMWVILIKTIRKIISHIFKMYKKVNNIKKLNILKLL